MLAHLTLQSCERLAVHGMTAIAFVATALAENTSADRCILNHESAANGMVGAAMALGMAQQVLPRRVSDAAMSSAHSVDTAVASTKLFAALSHSTECIDGDKEKASLSFFTQVLYFLFHCSGVIS